MFGGSSGFIILILFLLMLSGNWGGFGGNATQSALTRAELYEGLSTQDIQNSLNNLGVGMNTGFSSVQASIADTNYRMADCCCQIKNAVHSEGEQTRALIQQNTIDSLAQQLQDAKNENLVTGLVTAQTIQTNNLENFMRTLINGCGCN